MMDSTIVVPTANSGLRVPPPGSNGPDRTEADLLAAALADNARLRRDLRELGDYASAIASVCLPLTRMLVDAGYGSPLAPNRIDIDRHLHTVLVGATLKVHNDAAGISVEVIDGQRERMVVGG